MERPIFKSNTMLFNRKSSCCCCLVIIIVPCTKTYKIIFLRLLFYKVLCIRNVPKNEYTKRPILFLRNYHFYLVRGSVIHNNKTCQNCQNENDSCFCRKSSVKILKSNNGKYIGLLIDSNCTSISNNTPNVPLIEQQIGILIAITRETIMMKCVTASYGEFLTI